MYERILVPTDGSPTAAAAMDEAVALADHFDAAIHVLHVIDSWHYDTSIDSAVAPLREAGEGYVESLAEVAASAAIPVETAVEVGAPAAHILEYAADHDIGLIVIGTSGGGGLPRRLLGSVSRYVVTHADRPVHVVPAASRTD